MIMFCYGRVFDSRILRYIVLHTTYESNYEVPVIVKFVVL